MSDFNLLIIDDDPDIRRLLNEMLAGRPEFHLLVAGDGKEAVRHFTQHKIDIVLTDIHMPGFTGLELMADMKKINLKPEILVMTANATPENVETARRIGARSVILKPFDDLDVVEKEIDKAVHAVTAARGGGNGHKGAAAAEAPRPAPAAKQPPIATPRPAPPVVGSAAAATPEAMPPPRPAPPTPASPPAPASVPVHAVPATAAAPGPAMEEAPELPADLEAIFQAEANLDTGRMQMQVPIICLQTWEERGAIAALRQTAASLQREFYTWSASRGLVKDAGQPMGEMYRDPVRALDFIRRQKTKGLYVLADFRPCLEDGSIVRTLREMVMEMETSRGMVILTGPRMPVPPELEPACAVFDWPAGGGTDLQALYREVGAEVEASYGRPVRLDPAAREALLTQVKEMPAGRARFEIARALMARARRPT
jgi:CheY-like chemotaxis protein